MPVTSFLFGPPPAAGAWRKLHNEASGLQTLLFGRRGLFRPKPALLVEEGAAPGLPTNMPVDLMLDEPGDADLVCFAVELFAMEGGLPQSLGAAVSRAAEIALGNQTRQIVEGREREHRSRALVQRLAEALPPERREDPDVASILAEAGSRGARSATVVRVTHRASPDEAHPGESVDFSPATLPDRWEAGAHSMREALRRLEAESAEGDKSGGLVIHDVGG
ncbi:MAG: hypothetical protein AVDCRST_MAG08-540 [uncultured Acetobacteraceae bacterium]|uniref:DUF3734 domain-containing protein n=1 Tax=uncultured Acetobacteraceae bacterium TaxID=169975 RepID=A0A6J4HBY8_9PROT|nr:MAG: hypothetical protein AVDCRST_MAG08-540 [uncultured Acetobacteraceae bacterium]